MKTLALMTLLLASLATSALSRETRRASALRTSDVASDTASHPFSHSPEALFPAGNDFGNS